MEVSFSKEVQALRLGRGEVFHGEGILAITKALLQSGVAYVGGYQGAPVSHLLDVMVQARPYMDELGVHVEACSNEASAAAMLGASIHYPLRGAVTWKSIVGTNVAADALSNLASPGVKGGALIVVGEDYGEGASVIQERTHAYALKSSLLMLDPRPELANMVRMVEEGFRLSEASNMPAILELRIRACHVRGSFECKDNVAPPVSTRHLIDEPAGFDYMRLAHPPVTFRHEKLKVEERIPAARRYIAGHGLNELFAGKREDVGLIVQGGLYNSLIRALQQLGLADGFGESELPILALNVTFPLVPEEISAFCSAKRAVLVLEEGQPEYIEQDILSTLHRLDIQTPLHGKDMLSATGEYTVEAMVAGLSKFVSRYLPEQSVEAAGEWLQANARRRQEVAGQLGAPLPARPPSFCIGCPERPVFAALKLAQQERGDCAHRRRHRLPCLRHLRALLLGPLDPGLRHEPRQPRGRLADDEPARACDHGRRRLLAQRTAHRRAERALQWRRRGAAHHEERLHLGHRHAGHHLHARRRGEGARARQAAEPGRPQHHHRVHAHRPGGEVDAHGAHLPRRCDAQDAGGGLHHRLQRSQGRSSPRANASSSGSAASSPGSPRCSRPASAWCA